jgi:mono/diheme cytochrome c family protein
VARRLPKPNDVMKTVLLTLLIAAALAVVGAFAFVRLGLYDTSATVPHTQPVYSLLDATKRYSVRRRAAGLETPPMTDPARLALGAACYRQHCAQCHGGPGASREPVGSSLQPVPGPLVDAARRWKPREVYWITRHGVKMSGMPAWELRLSDAELWAVAAFVNRLGDLSPADYARTIEQADGQACPATARCDDPAGCRPGRTADALPLQPRTPDQQAELALQQYACIACHRIPGVVGPDTHVGPPLERLGRREVLASGMPMNADNLVRWIVDPKAIDPGTAMPSMGVSEAHARLMADYLLGKR